MKKITLIICGLFLSLTSHAFDGEDSAQRLANTPQATNITSSGSSQYDTLMQQLWAFADRDSVNCNTSYDSSAHALICNCANEGGNEPLSGQVEIARVVFGRAKSPLHPNSIRGVVCERSQFSWTIGGWDSRCNRTRRRNPTYFNTPRVSGRMLNSCVRSIEIAARQDFVDSPQEVFALNYCSSNPSAYRRGRAGMPRWCRTLVASGGCTGSHCFGFANSSANRVVPPTSAPSVIVQIFNVFKDFFVIEKAEAVVSDTKVVNTNSTKKVYIEDKIKKILKEKYPTFKTFEFKDFNKNVRNLMGDTRDNLPMAATGDYNGDQKNDLLLFGRNQRKDTVLAFISDGNNYKSHVALSEEPYKKPLSSYIVNIDQKNVKFDKGPARDAFQLESFGGAVRERLLNKNEFSDNLKGQGFAYKKSVKAQFTKPKK